MKIVLTGGPSAGKTTVAEALVRAHWEDLLLVPESASILFRGGFPRENSAEAVVCQQRAIYHVQRELEEVKQMEAGSRSLICDRGTLDGLAYWPRSEAEFFAAMNTTLEAELQRYDWVLHLETAARGAYLPSSIRMESFAAAQRLDEHTKWAWSAHPRRLIIQNNRNFSAKINLALGAMRRILAGDSLPAIAQFLRD